MIESGKEKIFSFAHMGSYHFIIKKLLENTLDCKVVAPPPITKKTIELGSKHSPDFVCIPFKYNLGNYIEALNAGANVLVTAGGGCRYGYYYETHRKILEDLGYEFEFFNILNAEKFKPSLYYKEFKKVNNKLTFLIFFKSFLFAYHQVIALDSVETFIRSNIGFEVKEGSFEKLEKEFLIKLERAKTISEVKHLHKIYFNKFKSIEINKPKDVIKVGIVGELYLLMEPFSNYFMEKELAKHGVEVKRNINISYLFFNKEHRNRKKLLNKTQGYLKYDSGGDGTDTIARACEMIDDGFAGIIHLKPMGCIPEINIMPSLQRISSDKKIPVLYFSFDSQIANTGVNTRLEAFIDMLKMQRGLL